MSGSTPTLGWKDQEQVDWYLDRIDHLPPRAAGEELLAELLPADPQRVLDLGCGDGRLIALVLDARPEVDEAVGLDNSDPMLDKARRRFAGDERVQFAHRDLADPLVVEGPFDVIVSGFALHHLEHVRKRSLLEEVTARLAPGGLYANLEVVASATPELHAAFLAAIGRTVDDPEDRLADVEQQLTWMCEAGLEQVDCLWRWRGFALLVGRAPHGAPSGST